MLLSKIIRKKFDAVWGRYDGNPAFYYFSPKDFPDIKSESFDIVGDRNITLKGYFYYYGEMNPQKLVIFDHGIGSGHLDYFKEIEYLARNGYTVYSYDHTGCVESGGKGIYGFAQGINDIDHVIGKLKHDSRFMNTNFRLVGHSWGGYSAMNAAALHQEVTHVVSLAGFLSARSLEEQYLPDFVMKYSDEVMQWERENNPAYADMDARNSIKSSNAKLLHFQSTDDQMVKFELCYVPLSEALNGRKNTMLVKLTDRNHDPNRTEAAVRAKAQMLEEFNKLNKKHKLDSKEAQEAFKKAHDWDAMTEQDPDVWNKILDFLEK